MKKSLVPNYFALLTGFFLSLNTLIPTSSYSQEKVSFYSADSLKITADMYMKDFNLPFILLFHQGGSSRGEYLEIAKKLLKLDYNCLAVDLRVGDKSNYVVNETALRARKEKRSGKLIEAEKDINAAICYIRKFNRQPVVLIGSSFSASLCLMVARDNPDVIAVAAFSPGEFFMPETVVRDKISGITQPVFISMTELEYDFINRMLIGIPEENRSIFSPSKGKGEHGVRMLWSTNDSSDECWLELLLFFKKIQFL